MRRGRAVDSESEEEPEMETVEYVVCTIHPFDQSVILDAFGVDVDATYDQFSITYGEAILNMSNALKMTMYGTASDGSVPPISDAELNLFLASLDCSGKRKELMRCALSLVGRVPYFWGGKSAPGWNSEWNTPKLVTSAGSSSTGTIRPYGLDCSGFTEWVYQTGAWRHPLRRDMEPVGCHPRHHRGGTAARRPGLYGGARYRPGQSCPALCGRGRRRK